ncbi:glycosyltransferase involved in cell wall biosynthesis [Conyzicola lurida]|uniref:4,4'-diaponeurosporenoate glycosyltransferase n=1 Tax=Conyzicola lurida TaxID=1172621 RepID=A0A841AP18_9MICO|nr:glycosyltransferase [Conyzicola lurida]MBB5843343.1 glycosyltransferase involved in cell wall biosynthesis [Conyzicola lurida]
MIPAAVLVVIPARDEEALVARCLDSVTEATRVLHARYPDLAVSVLVVADSCLDATARIARGYPGVEVLEIDAANVGIARATGVRQLLASSGPLADRLWIANTDADSVVPRRWLLEQVELAESGHRLVVGTVSPDLADLSPAQVSAVRASQPDGVPIANGHVHGANLGLRADVYLEAGGFTGLPEHEDVALVDRCVALGVVPHASNRADVLTSGRQVGRTPGGFARYLRVDLLAEPAPL